MSPAARSGKPKPASRGAWWLRGRGAGRGSLAVWLAAACLASVAAYGGWRLARPLVVGRREYVLHLHDVEVTEPPRWIRCDVRGEALRAAGFDQPQSMLDDELVERVERAFRLHPWVEEVTRVQKSFPSRVAVELVYRRPACLVRFGDGWLAVDRHGVWLPSADFSGQDVARYPHVSGIQSTPVGPEGTPWGDPRLAACAAIAAELAEVWRPLEMAELMPIPETGGDPAAPHYRYELVTAVGSRVIWGSPIGQERPDEPAARLKLDWLRGLAGKGRKLEVDGQPHIYDLRQVQQMTAPERTAERSR